MKSVSYKRPLNITGSSSFNSKATAETETTETSFLSSVVAVAVADGEGVKFDDKAIAIHSILSRHDMTDEEIIATWYQDEEYSKITKDCCKQIKKMEKGEALKDKKYCSRGLETHTKLHSKAKTLNREEAIDAVLDEQEEQQALGVVDEEAIAQCYQTFSSSCQLWAHTIGLRDQRAAEAFIDD